MKKPQKREKTDAFEREGSVERVRRKGVSNTKVVEKKLIYNFE